MLTLAVNPCDPANWTQSIAWVEMVTFLPIVLIDSDKRLFHTVEWPEADQVLLTDQEGNSWVMEASSGRLEKAP